MQLKLTRSQRESGVLSRAVLFCLDARVQLTPEEQASVNRYKLGGQLIYNSEASKQRVKAGEAAMADGTGSGGFKALAQFALARLHLNITVDSLQRGQHIECKSLDELLGAEEALMEACQNLRAYLDTAASFDGREVLVDFNGKEPAVVSTVAPPALAVPSLHAASTSAPAHSADSTPSPVYADAPALTQARYIEPSGPDLVSKWFDDRLAALGWSWRTASPEKRALVIAAGLLVLIVLYEVL